MKVFTLSCIILNDRIDDYIAMKIQ